MLEFFTRTDENDAIVILKKDHDTVKDIFDQFEKAESLREKKKLVAQAIMELKIHATIEEELFYPALRSKPQVDKALVNEADEEHHVAKLLIAELELMDGSESHYDAKFTVLSENIKHHIKEEEGDLFPQARKTDIDFVALGKGLMMRKSQLKAKGVPACAEERMISAHAKGSGDSPALTAKRIPSKRVKTIAKSTISKAVKGVKTSAKKLVKNTKTAATKTMKKKRA
jgi:hypothetical protein